MNNGNFSHYIARRAADPNFAEKPFALWEQDESISWHDFQENTTRVAGWLAGQGVGDGEPLLLVLPDSRSWLTCFFAAVNVGAVPVLVNFSDPFHLAQVIAAQECARLLIAAGTDLPSVPLDRQRILTFTSEAVASSCPFNGAIAKDSNSAFLALYTSGTSGTPKYVEKSYGNMLSELHFLSRLLPMQAGDRVLSTVPDLHIYGLLFAVLLPIITGATMVKASSFLPRRVIDTAKRYQASFLVAAPVHYQAFLQIQPLPGLPQLDWAISSGAPLAATTARTFCRKSGAPIVEVYGSTETGGIAYRIWNDLQPEPALTLFPYIEATREKEMGELLIKSTAISTNMLGKTTNNWYNTGDLVEFLAGVREFRIVGRRQQILKSAGKRIAIAQLEQELEKISGVKQAAIIRISKAGLRGESAVAFVELTPGYQLEASEIKKQFAKISTNSGVLHKVIVSPNIPRNANGKIAYPVLIEMWKQQ